MLAKELDTISQGLILIAVVLAIIAVGVWVRTDGMESRAHAGTATPTATTTDRSVAGIPDAGRQRESMIEELKTLNDRLAAIEEGLKEGRFQIQMLEPKDGGAKEAGKAR
jgi:hypothetical protein